MINIFVFALLFVSLFSPVWSKEGIGEFQPGMDGDSLSRLSLPLPILEGGYHLFVDRDKQVCFRIFLERTAPKKWRISSLHLMDMNFAQKVYISSDHQILTGVSLSSLATGKGTGIGDSQEKVLKAYGPPQNKTTLPGVIYWNYYLPDSPFRLSIGFIKNQAVSLYLALQP